MMDNISTNGKLEMDSLVQCIAHVREQGYTENFMSKEEGFITTGENEKQYAPEDIKIASFYRFEGESDPGDNSILYTIETPDGKKGYLTNAYGAYSDTNITKFIELVEDIQKKQKGE